MAMVIDNKFDFGDIVYQLTDPDQNPGIVVSIEIYKGGEYLYKVSKGGVTSSHYDFELSTDKNVLIAV